MSLLGELWSGGITPEKPQGSSVSGEAKLAKIGLTYSEAVCSSSEEQGRSKQVMGEPQGKARTLAGAKRPIFLGEQACRWCFR